MRSIEFRIWLNGSFHYWGFVELRAGKVFAGLPANNQDRLSMDEAEIRSQQFTGLLDKNGKKIWEGDLVKNYYWNDPYKIIFYDGSFRRWYGRKEEPTQDIRGIAFDEFEAKGSEVIGNIYENSALLK